MNIEPKARHEGHSFNHFSNIIAGPLGGKGVAYSLHLFTHIIHSASCSEATPEREASEREEDITVRKRAYGMATPYSLTLLIQ